MNTDPPCRARRPSDQVSTKPGERTAAPLNTRASPTGQALARSGRRGGVSAAPRCTVASAWDAMVRGISATTTGVRRRRPGRTALATVGVQSGCKLSATERNSEQLRPPQSAESHRIRLDRSGWGPGGRRFKSCLPDTPKSLHSGGFGGIPASGPDPGRRDNVLPVACPPLASGLGVWVACTGTIPDQRSLLVSGRPNLPNEGEAASRRRLDRVEAADDRLLPVQAPGGPVAPPVLLLVLGEEALVRRGRLPAVDDEV